MIRVFCDFDGTVSIDDIGENFFRAFAGEKADGFTEDSLPGKLAMQDWLVQLCDSIQSINKKDFETYIARFSIDPDFKPFVKFVEENGIELTIVSDGLDAYIEQVLACEGLNHVRFFANHLEFIEKEGLHKLAISFPYTNAECKLCGNCKRNHMITSSADEDIIVYIGDGYSDRCPVHYADFVFAKGRLIKYCQQQNITYFAFTHFGSVKVKLEEIMKRKHIRRRQEAAMARREAFMQE